MGLTAVPPGQIATIVTSLEMLSPPKPRALPPAPLRLARWRSPAPDSYRALFRRIGEPWLWFSRLVMTDATLAAIIDHPDVEVFAAVDAQGIEVGLLELDFRDPGTCELAFFGLIPELTGKGIGQWLMGHAMGLAWRKGVERVWVHSCTLDSPAALGFYRKAGFVPYARAVETFADPRLAGVLSRDAAPHVPIIER